MRALAENTDTILKELRMVNQVRDEPAIMIGHVIQSGYLLLLGNIQYFTGGAGAEGEIAKYLEKNRTITKLGYNFTVPSFRTKVDSLIMRNLDYGKSYVCLTAATSVNYN